MVISYKSEGHSFVIARVQCSLTAKLKVLIFHAVESYCFITIYFSTQGDKTHKKTSDPNHRLEN